MYRKWSCYYLLLVWLESHRRKDENRRIFGNILLCKQELSNGHWRSPQLSSFIRSHGQVVAQEEPARTETDMGSMSVTQESPSGWWLTKSKTKDALFIKGVCSIQGMMTIFFKWLGMDVPAADTCFDIFWQGLHFVELLGDLWLFGLTRRLNLF